MKIIFDIKTEKAQQILCPLIPEYRILAINTLDNEIIELSSGYTDPDECEADMLRMREEYPNHTLKMEKY